MSVLVISSSKMKIIITGLLVCCFLQSTGAENDCTKCPTFPDFITEELDHCGCEDYYDELTSRCVDYFQCSSFASLPEVVEFMEDVDMKQYAWDISDNLLNSNNRTDFMERLSKLISKNTIESVFKGVKNKQEIDEINNFADTEWVKELLQRRIKNSVDKHNKAVDILIDILKNKRIAARCKEDRHCRLVIVLKKSRRAMRKLISQMFVDVIRQVYFGLKEMEMEKHVYCKKMKCPVIDAIIAHKEFIRGINAHTDILKDSVAAITTDLLISINKKSMHSKFHH